MTTEFLFPLLWLLGFGLGWYAGWRARGEWDAQSLADEIKRIDRMWSDATAKSANRQGKS